MQPRCFAVCDRAVGFVPLSFGPLLFCNLLCLVAVFFVLFLKVSVFIIIVVVSFCTVKATGSLCLLTAQRL
jgi:hypothetical protein